MKPLCIDLYAGLGGWTEGFLAEGYEVIGFDNHQHVYGEARYPGQLVIQDVLTLHGSQFAGADVIVASPPCQAYSYMAMPWSRAKAMAAEIRESTAKLLELNRLFWACLDIQEQASRAAGHRIPLVIENVKGAQPWVGPAKAHFGSFYLWGDVESVGGRVVMRPEFGAGIAAATLRKNGGAGTWFGISHGETTDCSGHARKALGFEPPQGVKQGGSGAEWFDKALDERRKAATAGRKVPMNFHQHENTGQPGASFQSTAVAATGSNSRKAASAMIAKIPFDLARFIARSFYPKEKANAEALAV